MTQSLKAAFHCEIDTAGKNIGTVLVPETLTLTLLVGEQLVTRKVSSQCLPEDVRTDLAAMIDAQILTDNKVAQPISSDSTEPNFKPVELPSVAMAAVDATESMSLF